MNVVLTISNSDSAPVLEQRRARLTMRRCIRHAAIHGVMVDAGNLEQGVEAGLAVLTILDFGEVDRMVELAHRPAELDAILFGGIGKTGANSAALSSIAGTSLFKTFDVIALIQTFLDVSGPNPLRVERA